MENINQKQILVVAFRFPPMGGVGSRRWAKFAKVFAEKGYKVHIITPNYPFKDPVNWGRDVKSSNIIIHKIKTDYPMWLLKPEKGFFLKVLAYLFKKTICRLFFYIDMAQGWEKNLLPAADQLIKEHQIKNVIVTGPPSSLHYCGSLIKMENPSVNLIQDYRDPWNSDRDYAYPTAIKKLWQKEKSVLMEQKAVMVSDKVVSVTGDMTDKMKILYPSFSKKFVTIHNGYDRDDFKKSRSHESSGFNLVYMGAMGYGKTGRSKALELIAEAIDSLNDEYFNKNLKINIYSELKEGFFKNSDNYPVFKRNFVFHSFVPNEEVPRILANHYGCLAINAPMDPHAFGTKIFDYMALGKRIFLVSNKGELYGLLSKKKEFTAAYQIKEVKKSLLQLKKEYLSKKRAVSTYPEFDIRNLAGIYEKIFVWG